MFRPYLIDEAQHLEDKALDELRCIHDDTGVPIVFACNESLRARTRPGAPAAFAQFVTRIGPRCHVRATPENIEALAHRYGIAGPNAVAWLRKTGAGLGGGRVAARLLDMCKDRGEINLAALERASLALGGGA